MKKYAVFLALILIITSVIVAGCGSTATSTAPAPASTPTAPAPAAAAKTTAAPASSPASAGSVITLSMAPGSCQPPPASGATLAYVNMAKAIEDKTNGRVKVNIYWANSLAKSADCVTAVQTGIAQMAELAPHYEPGKLPLSLVGQLPGVGSDMWIRTQAYSDLIRQDPILSELTRYNMRPLFTHLLTEKRLITKNPIRTLADFKGKKIATSGITTGVVEALGGVPVSMSPAEQYDGLSKGIIDGIIAPTAAAWDFKFYEAGKYFATFDLGPTLTPVVINADSWKKISPQDQNILDSLTADFNRYSLDGFVKDGDPKAIQIMKDTGMTFIDPTDTDKAELQKVELAQANKWADNQDKAGLPGKKVLSDYESLIGKYQSQAK